MEKAQVAACEVGRSSANGPWHALQKASAGWVLLGESGLYYSQDFAHWEQTLKPQMAVPGDNAWPAAPRLFAANGLLFCFGSAEGAAYVSPDGKTWQNLGLPAKRDTWPLSFRGVFFANSCWHIWASHERDNAAISLEDDFRWDSWLVTGLLFAGSDVLQLAPECHFEQAFGKVSVTGLVRTNEGFVALCIAEPQSLGRAHLARSKDGISWQLGPWLDAHDCGLFARDFKVHEDRNRVRLMTFKDQVYVRGRSMYLVLPDMTLADICPKRVPNSLDCLRVEDDMAFYLGERLLLSRDLRHWQPVQAGSLQSMAFARDGSSLYWVENDGRIFRTELGL